MSKNRGFRFVAGALLAALLLLVNGCADDGTIRGVLVYDGQHTFQAGQVVQGDLAVVAGTAVVEPGATIAGSVWLVGGTLEVRGTVDGDVAGLAGRLTIADSARVAGDVNLAGSLTDIAPGAQVTGKVAESLTVPARQPQPLAAALQQAVLVALLALVLSFWFARALARVGAAAMAHPAVSLATGLLTGITGLVILVLVGFTLVLLPLALLLGLGAVLAVAVGWAGIGAWLAERLAPRWLPVPVAAALGSLLLVTVIQLAALLPVMGAVLGFGAAAWGLGAALLTRFGYQTFRPAAMPEVEPARRQAQ